MNFLKIAQVLVCSFRLTAVVVFESLVYNHVFLMVQVLEEDKKKFDAADVDKDGALTKKEHVAFLYPADFPHMHDVEMERVLMDHDKNGDGTITKEEFLADSGFYRKIAICLFKSIA